MDQTQLNSLTEEDLINLQQLVVEKIVEITSQINQINYSGASDFSTNCSNNLLLKSFTERGEQIFYYQSLFDKLLDLKIENINSLINSVPSSHRKLKI